MRKKISQILHHEILLDFRSKNFQCAGAYSLPFLFIYRVWKLLEAANNHWPAFTADRLYVRAVSAWSLVVGQSPVTRSVSYSLAEWTGNTSGQCRCASQAFTRSLTVLPCTPSCPPVSTPGMSRLPRRHCPGFVCHPLLPCGRTL